MDTALLILLIWFASGVTAAFIAKEKNRSIGGWFALGLLFGVFGLLAVAVVPTLSRVESQSVDTPQPKDDINKSFFMPKY